MNCNDCDKRNKCTRLCPEAEAYANQDYVSRSNREIIVDAVKLEAIHSHTGWINLTTSEIVLKLFFTERMTQREIAETLQITQQYVSKIIKKYKPILIKNIQKSVVSPREVSIEERSSEPWRKPLRSAAKQASLSQQSTTLTLDLRRPPKRSQQTTRASGNKRRLDH